MGRRPTTPGAIPQLRARKRGRKTWYYYDHGGTPRREEPLGSDYGLAIKRWAEIRRAGTEKLAEVITFRYVAMRYLAEVVPTKADRTQKDNAAELENLLAYFDDPPCPLDAIEPQHVNQYLRWRASAPVRAKREKALLSHIWNYARTEGYTKLANPCAGIKGASEKPRDVYVEDDDYARIWNTAEQCLQDAMDLAYLTGQRPADTLGMRDDDVRGGVLHVEQGKTGEKLRIAVSADLEAVLARIAARKESYTVHCSALVVTDRGRALSHAMLQRYWRQACRAAGVPDNVQFRDLRAKAGTDKADSAGDARQAQKQLGHSSITTTERYLRRRRGAKVEPTK